MKEQPRDVRMFDGVCGYDLGTDIIFLNMSRHYDLRDFKNYLADLLTLDWEVIDPETAKFREVADRSYERDLRKEAGCRVRKSEKGLGIIYDTN